MMESVLSHLQSFWVLNLIKYEGKKNSSEFEVTEKGGFDFKIGRTRSLQGPEL